MFLGPGDTIYQKPTVPEGGARRKVADVDHQSRVKYGIQSSIEAIKLKIQT